MFAERAAQRGGFHKPQQGPGKTLDVAWVHQESITALFHKIRDGAQARRHNWQVGGHGLDKDDPERLQVGGETEEAGLLVILIHFLRRHLSDHIAAWNLEVRAGADDRQPGVGELFPARAGTPQSGPRRLCVASPARQKILGFV